MDAYVDKAETGDSLVSKSNIFTDVLKIIFSPLFVSAFKERYLEFNIFFRQHLVAGLLMTYFLYKIIVISKANNFKYFSENSGVSSRILLIFFALKSPGR